MADKVMNAYAIDKEAVATFGEIFMANVPKMEECLETITRVEAYMSESAGHIDGEEADDLRVSMQGVKNYASNILAIFKGVQEASAAVNEKLGEAIAASRGTHAEVAQRASTANVGLKN